MKKSEYYPGSILLTIVLLVLCSAFMKKNDASPGGPAVKGGKWKMGVALYSFNRYSFATTLDKADSAGAKYVEGFFFHKMGKEFDDKIMGAISKEQVTKMKAMLDKKGLSMRSIYIGGAKNANEWKAFFDMAKECGAEFLVCEPPKQDWDILDSLAGIYKIKIAIHEHSKEKSLYWHPDSVLAAMKGHPNIGACADLGHWVRSGLDPVQCLKKLQGRILGIHLKDIDEVNNDKAKDVLVGTGVINFAAVIEELKRQNYKGMVNVECEHDWENNLPDVRGAIKYFNDLAEKSN